MSSSPPRRTHCAAYASPTADGHDPLDGLEDAEEGSRAPVTSTTGQHDERKFRRLAKEHRLNRQEATPTAFQAG